VVEFASRQLREQAKYSLLLVLTANDLPPPSSHHGSVECPRFTDRCIEASEAPISILVVGIGKGFPRMKALAERRPDDVVGSGGKKMTRKVLTFVEFGGGEAPEFEESLLGDIPDQVGEWATQRQQRQ
jgi:hypothetical protein